MCLSIGTPKKINFPFGTNGKFIFLGVKKVLAHCMCLNIATSKNRHFPFCDRWKVMVLGVPILKHFRVVEIISHISAEKYAF